MYVVSGNRILRGAQQTKTTEPRVTLLKETTTNWKEVVMRQWKTHLPINEPLINLLGSYWRPSIFQGVLDSTSMFRHWNGRSIGQAMAGLLLTRDCSLPFIALVNSSSSRLRGDGLETAGIAKAAALLFSGWERLSWKFSRSYSFIDGAAACGGVLWRKWWSTLPSAVYLVLVAGSLDSYWLSTNRKRNMQGNVIYSKLNT